MREDDDQQRIWEGVFDVEHITLADWAPPEDHYDDFTWEAWEQYVLDFERRTNQRFHEDDYYESTNE